MPSVHGRPYPIHTPLGRIMSERGLQVRQVADASGVYHRTMTEYLAGRKQIIPRHLAYLSRALDVDPDDLYFDPSELATA